MPESKKRNKSTRSQPSASKKLAMKNIGAVLDSNEQCISAMDYIIDPDKFGYEFTGKHLDNLKTIRLHLHNMQKLLSKMQKGTQKNDKSKTYLNIL